jgi:hypothetical protein
MAKITREAQVVFGGDGSSDNFAKFGSQAAGAPIKTKNIATIQSLAAWGDGLQEAVWPVNKAPFLEDLNSLFFVHSRQVAYILQEGMAEWNADTSYYIGSIVKKTGTGEFYRSLTDDNLGNALPMVAGDNANWAWQNPSGPGSGLDADTVDGFHASDVPTAGKLLPLNDDGQFPPEVFAGSVLQSIMDEDATWQTIAQVIPQDDTIPQIAEGVEILSVSITPKSATSKIRIRAQVPFTVNAANALIIAAFKDAGADAIAAQLCNTGGTTVSHGYIEHEFVAGSTDPIDITLRAGVSGGVCYLNGGAGGRTFGGVMRNSLVVEEIAAI